MPFPKINESSDAMNSLLLTSQVMPALNANSAIFQLYHGENKLIFNEVMSSALY